MKLIISAFGTLAYWIVCGIPYLMAQAYRSLLTWRAPKDAVFFKRVPLLMLTALHGGGYLFYAIDSTHYFLTLSRKLRGPFDDPSLGILNPSIWSRLCRLLDKELHHLLWDPVLGPLGPLWIWFILFGPICLGLTVWFMFKKGGSQDVDSENIGCLDLDLPKVQTLKARSKKKRDGVFLGASKSIRKRSLDLPDSWRTSHAYCVGATRSGKTRSVMLPLAFQDIKKGHPVLFFDGKGDAEHLELFCAQAERYSRAQDLMFFSLSDPERSHTYNPLGFGNATQKKDKLIGAFTWSEEHYKKACEDALLTVLLALEGTKQRYNLDDLYLCLTEPNAVHRVYELCENRSAKEHLEGYFNNFKSVTKEISGLVKDLGLIIKSDFWPLMDTYNPEIDLLEAVRQKKIVYLVLNTQAYQDTAERLARLFLQDLRAVSDHVQNRTPGAERAFTPIFIDEFNSFAFDAFGDFMSKCGGAGFALTLAHQSLGQLRKRSEYFKDEILDNANIKVIMRQDMPDSVEEFVRMIGTHTRQEFTDQTEDVLLFDRQHTGVGSARRVETFNIDPNRIKQLDKHQAALLIKQPFQYDLIQLDVCGRSPGRPGATERLLPPRTLPEKGVGIDLRGYLRNKAKAKRGLGKFNSQGRDH